MEAVATTHRASQEVQTPRASRTSAGHIDPLFASVGPRVRDGRSSYVWREFWTRAFTQRGWRPPEGLAP